MSLTRYEFLKKAANMTPPFMRRQHKRWKDRIEAERMHRFIESIRREAEKKA